MNRKPRSKLRLSKETVRGLSSDELEHAAGAASGYRCPSPYTQQITGCPCTLQCPTNICSIGTCAPTVLACPISKSIC